MRHIRVSDEDMKSQLNERPGAAERRGVFWRKPGVWVPLTLLSVALWGTAFPGVKFGYQLFQIDSSSSGAISSLLLFAGLRFMIAGLLTLIVTGVIEKRVPWPKGKAGNWGDIALLGVFQTILQYSFFFISMSNTTGATGSILSSTTAFMAVVLGSFFFANDRMDRNKTIGCLLGLAGVIVLNVNPFSPVELGFRLNGEGLMLLSALSGAIANVLSKKMTERNQPMLLSGWQFLLGGLVLFLFGFLTGGRLNAVSPAAWALLLYLGALSATAFSLWTIMLKYHPLSRLSIFKALIPVVGTIGSGLILHESILELHYAAALLLVVLGIIILNRAPREDIDVL
ncbi:MAG: DMT family transporter [Fastidiosipilaceae bacterium]|jgi:drug/metabolite transporter (DMT)-like permease